MYLFLLVYFFILAMCFSFWVFFLLPVRCILVVLFSFFLSFISLLCFWLYYSLYDSVTFSTVCLPKYLFFILWCLFALPRGTQRPKIQQKTATGWQWRSRDAELRPSMSHRRSVTSQQSIYKQERWKQERVSIPPPGRRLRKETCVEAHFVPLASPQSPLLLLTVCPKLKERKTT